MVGYCIYNCIGNCIVDGRNTAPVGNYLLVPMKQYQSDNHVVARWGTICQLVQEPSISIVSYVNLWLVCLYF